jgi:protein TonB
MAKQAAGAATPKAPQTPKGAAPAADVAHKPFGVLLASQPPSMAGGYSSGVISTVFHISLAFLLVATTMQGPEEEEEETTYVELVEEVPVPPPPPPPPPPQLTPEMPNVVTISQIEMPTVILDNIPAPQAVVFDRAALSSGTGTVVQRAESRDSTVANPDNPSFTPMTVRPQLTNIEEVQRVLMREYPAVLRDAGIGGAPVLWLFIGTNGVVENTRVYESSGFEALDAAAANVAAVMRFSPAYNRDQIVPVWVQIPIRFQVVN